MESVIGKILLLTSPAPGIREYGLYLGEKRFPLGIGYIGAMLAKHGYDYHLVDLYARDQEIDFSNYGLIGIHANTICFKNGTIPLLEKIRRSGFEGKIVIGGPHTSVYPESIPEYVDYIVKGEGEYAFLSIVKGEENRRFIEAERIKNLDELPRPDYDIFVPGLYNLGFEEAPEYKKVFTYSSSRGCPFNCHFCSSKKIFNRHWTCHSAERVVQDVEYLKNKFDLDGIYFREDNFTVNRKRIRAISELMIDKKVDISWKTETRVDLSYEDLELMHRAGCRLLYVGFESGSPRMLKLFNKQIDVEQSLKFAANCHKLGIKLYGSFIKEFPLETEEDRRLSEEFANKLGLARVCWNKFLALPGSEFFDRLSADPKMAEKFNTVVVGKDS